MDGMKRDAWRWAGWSMPRVTGFGFANLASALDLFDESACRVRRQGRCEDRTLCADCAWSQGTSGAAEVAPTR